MEDAEAMGEASPPTEAVPRLMITKMVLENFKSYAGRKEIGPFHKSFSSIVGPNGSGKSNVIDAMLFVFGKRAKKLRLNKVSELIHKSDAYPDLESAQVSVHFQDIIDVEEANLSESEKADDVKHPGYKVVPNTDLVVTRMAMRNNQSRYYLNSKPSNFTEVTQLLRKRGIDLDNNRFLILQGEVEQISMMKPKGQNEHEDGLLEYLEEIIGSNKYVKPIEEAAGEVEKLDDVRLEKLNRVKIIQKEKDNLEDAKTEAEQLQRKDCELSQRMNVLYHLYAHEASQNVEKISKKREELQEMLKSESEKLEKHDAQLKEMEELYNKSSAEYEVINKELMTSKTEFTAFERKDIKYREDIKHTKALIKKLQTAVKKEQKKQESLKEESETLEKSVPVKEKEKERVEENLKKEEGKLEKIMDSLKGETEVLRKQLEEAQEEVKPWHKLMNENEASKNKAETEIQLIEETMVNSQREVKEIETKLQSMSERQVEVAVELKKAKSDLTEKRKTLKKLEVEVTTAEKEEQEFDKTVRAQRSKVEENKAALRSNVESGTLLTQLRNESRGRGALAKAGLHGRLGDLGAIDSKFDVAISTACVALDFLVVEHTEGAQQCVKYLRDNDLGRATFIILDQLEYLKPHMDKAIKTPPGVARLFDLVNVRDEKFKVAFYYALRNTLVAKDLDEAVKVAFKGNQCVWRVVTLSGELIETSGAMSGGGQKAKKGGMAAQMATKTSEKEVAALEADLKVSMETLQRARSQKADCEKQIRVLTDEISALEILVPKLEMEAESIGPEQEELTKQLQAKKKLCSLSKDDEKKLKELKKSAQKSAAELSKASAKAAVIDQRISELQQKIMDAGGEKLRTQKAKVDELSKSAQEIARQISKAKVDMKSCVKNILKAEEAERKAKEEAEEAEQKLEQTRADFKQIEEDAFKVMEVYKKAEKLLEERGKELKAIQKEYDVVKATVGKMKTARIDIQNQLEDQDRVLGENTTRFAHWGTKLQTLQKEYESMVKEMLVEESDDEEEGEEGEEDANEAEEAKSIQGSEATEQGEGQTDAMAVDDEGKPNSSATSAEEEENEEKTVQGQQQSPSLKKNKKTKKDKSKRLEALPVLSAADLARFDREKIKHEVLLLEQERDALKKNVNMGAIAEYREKEKEFKERASVLEEATSERDRAREAFDDLRRRRLEEFMAGFSVITLKLKEMYQMITLGGDAELELVDSLDPFSEGIVFSVRPPKKSWKNISNLSGGEKTLSSLALVFALHHYKPTPLYVMDEIDAALDFKNVSIVANYIKERTKNAQFIIISLRNNMFELADRLVGIYKTHNATKSITINPKLFAMNKDNSNNNNDAVQTNSAPLQDRTNVM